MASIKNVSKNKSHQKAAIKKVLKRAVYQWKDCCKNSCDVPEHYAECLKEKIENQQAEAALRALS